MGAGGGTQASGGMSGFGTYCSAYGGQGASFVTANLTNAPGGPVVFAGNGAPGPFGGGGRAGNGTGINATGPGAGAGGAYDPASSGNRYNGGTGGNGLVLVEYLAVAP